MEVVDRIGYLLELARIALDAPKQDNLEEFTGKADRYLDEFNLFANDLEKLGKLASDGESEHKSEKAKALLKELSQVHKNVIKRANCELEHVGNLLGDFHRHSTGMKKYVDNLPSRITITGRRKG